MKCQLEDCYSTSAGTLGKDTDYTTGGTGVNDLTLVTTATEDICTEKWTLASNRVQCVHIQVKFKRPMVTANFDTVQKNIDVKFGYRKYELTA